MLSFDSCASNVSIFFEGELSAKNCIIGFKPLFRGNFVKFHILLILINPRVVCNVILLHCYAHSNIIHIPVILE